MISTFMTSFLPSSMNYCLWCLAVFIAVARADTPGCPPVTVANSYSGSFHSPNYPAFYPNNANCSYVITAPSGYYIQFWLVKFDTELCCDNLRLYNGNNTSAPVMQMLQGAIRSNTTYNSTGNYVYGNFISDASVTRPGFMFTYQAYPTNVVAHTTTANVPTHSTMAPCTPQSMIATNTQQMIQSNPPNMTYANSQHCEFYINATAGNIVQLKFKYFITQRFHDYLFIFDGPKYNSTALASLSGGDGNGRTFNTTQSVMRLEFITDQSIAYKGWSAQYKMSSPAPGK